MRIIIEDGDNNVADTRPSIEAPAEIMHLFIDAGPAPIEMLRRLGQASSEDLLPAEERAGPAPKSSKSSSGKPSSPPKEQLNPLREGETVARSRRSSSTEATTRRIEAVDAGSAPKIGPKKTTTKKK